MCVHVLSFVGPFDVVGPPKVEISHVQVLESEHAAARHGAELYTTDVDIFALLKDTVARNSKKAFLWSALAKRQAPRQPVLALGDKERPPPPVGVCRRLGGSIALVTVALVPAVCVGAFDGGGRGGCELLSL